MPRPSCSALLIITLLVQCALLSQSPRVDGDPVERRSSEPANAQFDEAVERAETLRQEKLATIDKEFEESVRRAGMEAKQLLRASLDAVKKAPSSDDNDAQMRAILEDIASLDARVEAAASRRAFGAVADASSREKPKDRGGASAASVKKGAVFSGRKEFFDGAGRVRDTQDYLITITRVDGDAFDGQSRQGADASLAITGTIDGAKITWKEVGSDNSRYVGHIDKDVVVAEFHGQNRSEKVSGRLEIRVTAGKKPSAQAVQRLREIQDAAAKLAAAKPNVSLGQGMMKSYVLLCALEKNIREQKLSVEEATAAAKEILEVADAGTARNRGGAPAEYQALIIQTLKELLKMK